jgi:thiamine-monophosphate kinase
MSMSNEPGEFALIDRYFRVPAEALQHARTDVALGIGDDAALLSVPPGRQLVAAIDTLVEGRHFPSGTNPRSLGHRALAVNLSDLAAMGAEPAWFLLALTMPEVNETFLGEFSAGLLELAQTHRMALIGGDTTAGPLSVSVQVLGLVPRGQALLRSGARSGDLLYVSGQPGDAAAGLALELGTTGHSACTATQRAWLRQRFLWPTPRIALGQSLRAFASACIDVSDGLAADALKLAVASGCGVQINVEQLPCSDALIAWTGLHGARQHALTGGDDYELCFTVPAAQQAAFLDHATNVKYPVTCIGFIRQQPGLSVQLQGTELRISPRGYDHFATPE